LPSNWEVKVSFVDNNDESELFGFLCVV